MTNETYGAAKDCCAEQYLLITGAWPAYPAASYVSVPHFKPSHQEKQEVSAPHPRAARGRRLCPETAGHRDLQESHMLAKGGEACALSMAFAGAQRVVFYTAFIGKRLFSKALEGRGGAGIPQAHGPG